MNEKVKETFEEFLAEVIALSIDEKKKCKLIMDMANIVSTVARQKNSRLEASKLHLATKAYAIRYAELSDSPLVKLLSSVFLEDK